MFSRPRNAWGFVGAQLYGADGVSVMGVEDACPTNVWSVSIREKKLDGPTTRGAFGPIGDGDA
jgi:hypothetical protein